MQARNVRNFANVPIMQSFPKTSVMGETLVLKKYQQLPTTEQVMVVDFIEFLLKKSKKRVVSPKKKKRVLGTLKGQIWMSADFNEPLDDLKEYMQ